ncbi:unnamed protein product, partial [Mesorhabditis spiculigera]
MLYCIRLEDAPTDERQPLNVIWRPFLEEFQRRVENVYNGIFVFLDNRHYAECRWLREKSRLKIAHGKWNPSDR